MIPVAKGAEPLQGCFFDDGLGEVAAHEVHSTESGHHGPMNGPIPGSRRSGATNRAIMAAKNHLKKLTELGLLRKVGEPTMKKFCKHHGKVEHVYRKDKRGYNRYKCKTCEYIAVKRRRHKIKQKLVDLLGGKCVKCGYNKCLRALSFHHRDRSTKKFGLGLVKIISWDKLVEEVEKCDLLCANCHMETEEVKTPRVPFFEKKEKEIFCLVCGKKTKNRKYCSHSCSNYAKRKRVRPSKKELMKLLETNSFVAVGKKYKVSDNSIRKWLKCD